MATVSAGLLVFRRNPGGLQVLIAHPGGPVWARRDAGAWTIPKGIVEPGEDRLAAAEREFTEELGIRPPGGPRLALGEIRQKNGKRVVAWAVEGDLDPSVVTSNHFDMEWPPKSGVVGSFPEVDRVAWMTIGEAQERLLPAQVPLLGRLTSTLDDRVPG